MTLRFSQEDAELFANASLDRNPLHLSERYARKSPFGEPVLHGVLGGISLLAASKKRPDHALSKVTMDFLNPIFCEIPYRIELQEDEKKTCANLFDGKRPLVSVQFEFIRKVLKNDLLPIQASKGVDAPTDVPLNDISIHSVRTESYFPSWPDLERVYSKYSLAKQGVSRADLAALFWCSYSVGMLIPGRRALFSKLKLALNPDFIFAVKPFDSKLIVEKIDPRFSSIQTKGSLGYGDNVFANAEMHSFSREPIPTAVNDLGAEQIETSEFKGKTALVIGASRGLGAALANALARKGCQVVANFLKSAEDASKLHSRVSLQQGDASDLSVCRKIIAQTIKQYGKLDYIVCNACPPIHSLLLESTTLDRIHEYLLKCISLVSVPLAESLPSLQKTKGTAVVISSSAVNDPPKDWPHYVAAKKAIEGLCQTAARQNPEVRFLIVRPPRMLTDLTNTSFGRSLMLSPEKAAEDILSQLLDPVDHGNCSTVGYDGLRFIRQ